MSAVVLPGPMAERPSGLVVPEHLAHVPEGPTSAPTATVERRAGAAQRGEATDPDGRRRLVLTREQRHLLTKFAREFKPFDIAAVLFCQSSRPVTRLATHPETGVEIPVTLWETIPGACGQMLEREGEGTDDPGYGCRCTRFHFVRG